MISIFKNINKVLYLSFCNFLSNRNGLNFLFESIFVMLLLIAVVVGFVNYYPVQQDTYILDYLKVNDVFIILSAENTTEQNRINQIMDFVFPQQNIEFYIDNTKVFGNISFERNDCIIRQENIIVKKDDLLETKEFKIKICH